MRQGHKLTRAHKEIISSHGLNADEWRLLEETEFYLKLVSKDKTKKKTIDKFMRRK